jgi:hypothetical protein
MDTNVCLSQPFRESKRTRQQVVASIPVDKQKSAHFRNFAHGWIVAFTASSGCVVSAAGDKRERKRPAHKMTREEAERLRALFRGTKPAELDDLSVLQRIGRVIARAIYKGPERDG